MSNTINCKTFLKSEAGLNVSPSAIVKFKEVLENFGKELIENSKEVVLARKRKTIQAEDIGKALDKIGDAEIKE